MQHHAAKDIMMDRIAQYSSDQRNFSSRRMRLSTLTRLRWLAALGQGAAVLAVAYGLEFALPIMACLALIGCSVALNIVLSMGFSTNHRLKPWPAFWMLSFDVLQLAALLYLTGGVQNPFAILLVVPVIISSSAQPVRFTFGLATIAAVAVLVLAINHLPLPWYGSTGFKQPDLLIGGSVLAILSTMSFAAIYAWRVSREAQQLSDALAATELVLQREQHLSTIDGLATAAAHELGTPLATIHVVLKELENALQRNAVLPENLHEDVSLLRSQSARCRDILGRLRNLSDEGADHIGSLSLSTLIEEAIAPYRGPDIDLEAQRLDAVGPEPVSIRRPGVVYGIGNIVENATDFARDWVSVGWSWTDEAVTIEIKDDGPGFSLSVLDHIGEPYVSDRLMQRAGTGESLAGGLGLGLFIARTLLERSGADVTFSNSPIIGEGAIVRIVWSRRDFEAERDK